MALIGALLVTGSGCISTPQTKALITPMGAIGYHTFRPPQARPPTPSEIDRMVAHVNHAVASSEE
jgi:hypothetical protein